MLTDKCRRCEELEDIIFLGLMMLEHPHCGIDREYVVRQMRDQLRDEQIARVAVGP